MASAAPAGGAALARGKQRQPTAAESAAQLEFGRKLAADMGKPSNEPVLKKEGQGLSKKQVADLERLVERARQWCELNGRKYEDPEFPPGDAALYGRTSPEQLPEMPQLGEVGGWRRPSEFAPDAPVLLKEAWTVENIRQGAVDNRWLISSINILSTNVEQLMRALLDPTKASKGGRVDERERSEVHAFGQRHGFYVCRFYEDDPATDDDWVVVLVDDRLPVSALDGRPCFASHPDPNVYWGMILEKAAAKLAGSYAALRGGTVKQGLKLLTGGRVPEPPRLSTPEGLALIPPSSTPNALWNIIMEKTSTNCVVGCSHAAKEDAGLGVDERRAIDELERMGLVARRAYAVAACGEAMGYKLLKLRLPLAPAAEQARRADKPSEWVGRFSDDSDDWRPQLRQMLSYSRDANDNTFWMMYEDFCKYFNKVYFCRMADDIWTKFVVQSRWMDESAGGAPAHLSWRSNPQWLLRVESRPVQLTITLSQADARKASGNGRGYATAIGVHIVRGNPGADAKRRKLFVGRDDLVGSAGPRFGQEVMLEITLDPSARPYVLVPSAHAPGVEGAFKLTVAADDLNDDGVPDFGFVPVREEDDWHTSALHGEWAVGSTAGGGPTTAAGWAKNPQYQLTTEARGRVYVFLELVDVDDDMRDQKGMQAEPDYPEIGLVLADGTGDQILLEGPPSVLREAAPRKAAGLYVELELDARTGSDDAPPVVLVPYTLAPDVAHKFVLTVYSDAPHAVERVLGRAPPRDEAACDFCHAPAVIHKVLAKIDELEAKGERLKALEARFAHKARVCYNNRDADCGPDWDAWNAQKAELDAALLRLGGLGALAVAAKPAPPGAGRSEYASMLASIEDDVRRSLRDCPDVDVDLRNMRIALRRMITFGGGRDVFADPERDTGLLQQVAKAVSACNALLHERGRAPLHVAVEGFISSNAPCYLPCCAAYQGQREGAPNCTLARARAHLCKATLCARLAELDATGRVPSANAAAALVSARGHRFSTANALPGYDDGRNHPQNRRVEIRVLEPAEIESRRREDAEIESRAAHAEARAAAPGGGAYANGGGAHARAYGGGGDFDDMAPVAQPQPQPQQQPQPQPQQQPQQQQPWQEQQQQQQQRWEQQLYEQQPQQWEQQQQQQPYEQQQQAAHVPPPAPTGAYAAPPPPPPLPAEQPQPSSQAAEQALREDLLSVEPAVAAAVGASCPAVALRPRECAVVLTRHPRFVPSSGRFFDTAAEDTALTQAAQLIAAVDRQLGAARRPAPLLAVEAFAPTHDPDAELVASARADACAKLLGARLAQEGVEGFAPHSRPQRLVALGSRRIVPLPRDEPSGAQPASVELRFVSPAEWSELARARQQQDDAAARAEAERDAAEQRAKAAEEAARREAARQEGVQRGAWAGAQKQAARPASRKGSAANVHAAAPAAAAARPKPPPAAAAGAPASSSKKKVTRSRMCVIT